MVTALGMSELLGNAAYGSYYEYLSSETKFKIDQEVARFVEEGMSRATALLKDKRKELDTLAKALMEYETLDLEEVKKVLKGEKLDKMSILIQTPLKLPEIVLPPGMGEETSSPSPSPAPAREVRTADPEVNDGPGGGVGGAKM